MKVSFIASGDSLLLVMLLIAVIQDLMRSVT